MGETKAKKAIQKRKKALLFDLKERIFHAESKNFITKKLLPMKFEKKVNWLYFFCKKFK